MSQGNQDYAAWAGVGVFCITSIALILIWHYFHTQISWAVMWLSYWAIYGLYGVQKLFLMANFERGFFWLVNNKDYSRMLEMAGTVPKMDMSSVSYKAFPRHLMSIAILLRIAFPPFALYWVYKTYKATEAARLRTTYNIFSLAKHNMRFFPHIRPAILANLLKSDPDKGYFRREASPIRFCILNGLIRFYERDYKNAITGKIFTASLDPADEGKDGVRVIKDDLTNHISKLHRSCIFDEAGCRDVFAGQVGKRWTSSNDLPPLTRALYAAFIAMACGDKDTAFRLLRQFSATWKHPKDTNPVVEFSTDGVDAVIHKFEGDQRIQDLHKAHAYDTTMMMGALYAARSKGKLLCSNFLWMKVVDRTLWYCLNQAGGQTTWSESAGPAAHFFAERIVGRGIEPLQLDEALFGMKEFLTEQEGWLYSLDFEQSIIR